jgi:hypothetical protein
MKKNIPVLLLSFFYLAGPAISQTSYDLWVVETSGRGSQLKILDQTAKTLTDRPEYDNQPSFINEYQLVFSAADEKGNHDIIVYNFNSKKFTNLTKTPDVSEFSPKLTDCGLYISAVVMEADKTQRLWLYPLNFGEPELLYDDIQPVGYYDWYDNKAALYVLGQPNKIIYVKGKTDHLEIDTNIGRSVNTRPKTAEISYLWLTEKAKFGDLEAFSLKSYDLDSQKSTDLGFGLEGSQDFIWLDKNHLIMARENTIYSRKIGEKNWKTIGKINSETHQNISRMAYSKDLNLLVFAMERK